MYEHIAELRVRIIKSLIAICVMVIVAYIYYQPILKIIISPICTIKLQDHNKVYGVTSTATYCDNDLLVTNGLLKPLHMMVQIVLMTSIILSSPVWIYQMYAFILPGLYTKEKKYIYTFLSIALPLFLLGVFVAYKILPYAVSALISVTPVGVKNLIPIDNYINFATHLIIIFGVSFNLPVIILMLNMLNILSHLTIRRLWRYIIFGIFVISGALIPTGDLLTMLLLAIPLTLLYLLILLISYLHDKRKQ